MPVRRHTKRFGRHAQQVACGRGERVPEGRGEPHLRCFQACCGLGPTAQLGSLNGLGIALLLSSELFLLLALAELPGIVEIANIGISRAISPTSAHTHTSTRKHTHGMADDERRH